MKHAPEPGYRHGSAERAGVLLVNLGTPDAPTAPALRRYLAEFLGDPRVVEIPRALWLLILHGIILRVRPQKSAAKYATVWTEEGSPLKVWTEKQATLLAGYLGERGHPVLVKPAMRYGEPSVARQLDALKAEGGNPFFDYQLPQATISLKQGAGRLIRTETDRGVLMICDPRLVDKPYGKRIWRSLPPMRRTRELYDVEAFFGADAAPR